MNELPIIKDKSHGLQRRFIILPMIKPIPKSLQNKYLSQQLNQELPGILNWAINGLIRLDKNKYNFTISNNMAAIKQKFFNDVSPMADFITHCLKANPSNTNITGKDLMAAFKSWSELKKYNVVHLLSPVSFWREFKIETQKLGLEYKNEILWRYSCQRY